MPAAFFFDPAGSRSPQTERGTIMQLGKAIRLERIINRKSRRTIIVPMDHGVTVGPIEGLTDMRATVNEVAEGGADAVIMHKGLVRCSHRGAGRDVGLILHLSAGTNLTPTPGAKVLVCSVAEAVRMGADGVSIHVNLGDPAERDMLADLGRIARDCDSWGMPLIAMMYGRGPLIKNQYDAEIVAHCARVACELGADVIKVPYCGDIDGFAAAVGSCCVPVVIAGGEKMDSTREFLQMVHDSLRAGGAGLSVGRNVFQHASPRLLCKALAAVVHDNASVEEALALMGNA